jgi:uncharacterized delta-60 repeat protein
VFSLPDPVLAATTGSSETRQLVVYPATAGIHAGKILAAASLSTTGATSNSRRFAVVRFNADGSPDTSFGAGLGYVLLNPGESHGVYVAGLELDSQQRIVLTGYHADTSDVCKVYVTRLTSAGTNDTTFTTTDLNAPGGYCGHPSALVVLPGDKLESINNWNNPDGSQLLHLMVFGSDGQPDSTAFTGNTYAKRMPAVATGKTMFEPNNAVLDSTGKIIIVGEQCAGGWNVAYSACESVVARVTTDGTWDTTFGTNGYTALTFGTSGSIPQRLMDLAFDSAKNIIAVGYNQGATTGTIMKLTPTGALDMSFGTSGRLTPQLITGGTQFEFDDVVIDEDDRLVLTGYSDSGGSLLVTARYDRNGTLDTSYGTAGFSTTPTGAIVWSSALQPDGRLVVVGSYPRTGGGYEMAAWRFWP